MKNSNPSPLETFPCSDCQAGIMRMQSTTYFTWLMDELITVPDFPSWVCDVCGRRVYDQAAINHLHLMLNPNAGRRLTRRYIEPSQDHPSPPPL